MAERSYPLGNRRKGYTSPKGTFDPARYAWTINNAGQFVIMVNPVDEGSTIAGPNVRLFHPIPGKTFNISWDLTNLTAEELRAMREIFDAAFDWALPICERRDKEAADAFNEGDDSQIRVYRAVPQLVFRKRLESEHSEGVQHGPEDVPPMDGGREGSDGGDSGGIREPLDDVAECDEGGSEPEDNRPTPHQPPVIRQVGEDRS